MNKLFGVHGRVVVYVSAALLVVAVGIAVALMQKHARRSDGAAQNRERPAWRYRQSAPDDEGSPSPAAKWSGVVRAAWYDVPPDSLARRRAGVEELTAAHNKLPLGTLVRVS